MTLRAIVSSLGKLASSKNTTLLAVHLEGLSPSNVCCLSIADLYVASISVSVDWKNQYINFHTLYTCSEH